MIGEILSVTLSDHKDMILSFHHKGRILRIQKSISSLSLSHTHTHTQIGVDSFGVQAEEFGAEIFAVEGELSGLRVSEAE